MLAVSLKGLVWLVTLITGALFVAESWTALLVAVPGLVGLCWATYHYTRVARGRGGGNRR